MYNPIDSSLPLIPSPWAEKIPFDPSLDRWTNFERYHQVVRKALKRYLSTWVMATEEERERGIDVAEAGLLSAIRTFNPDRNLAFESYAYMAITSDLVRWRQRVAVDRARANTDTVQISDDETVNPSDRFIPAEEMSLGLLISTCPGLTDQQRQLLRCRHELDQTNEQTAVTMAEFTGRKYTREWVRRLTKDAELVLASHLTQ